MRWPGAALLLLGCGALAAAEFRSVSQAAIVYDGPSENAERRWVVAAGYPLEVLVRLRQWTKVRDSGGAIGWVESSALGETRTVIVTGANVLVREQPNEAAKPVFRAAQELLLEWHEGAPKGWAKVKHRDGLAGYVATRQVWGAE